MQPHSAPTRLRFTATVLTPIALPAYAGSALRGAFGHAYRALACTTRAPDCQGCPLVTSCPYPAVFAPRHIPALIAEPQAPNSLPTPPAPHSPHSPHPATPSESPPYLVEPFTCAPQTATPSQPLARSLLEGDELTFHMVIWGAAHAHLPLILMAWQRALKRGLGLRLLAPKHPDDAADTDAADAASPELRLPLGTAELRTLHAITAAGQALPLWHDEAGALDSAALNAAAYALPPCPDWLAQGCMVKLVSPLRVQQNSHVLAANALTAQAILTAMLRRCQAAGLSVQLPRIRDAAAKLHLTKHLRWRDASRYSATQQQATPLGGLVGNLVFESDMRPFWPLLHAAQWLHLGKETVFGLGAVEVLPNLAAHKTS